MMRIFLCIIVALASVVVAGCTNQDSGLAVSNPPSASSVMSGAPKESGEESAASTGDDAAASAESIDLLAQADMITKQFVAYSLNQSMLEGGFEALTELAINSFVLTIPLTTEPDYIYKDFVISAEGQPHIYPMDKVQQVVYELFGKENWQIKNGNVEWDESQNAYSSGLEFGIGNFLTCTELSSSLSPDGKSIISTFNVVTDMAVDEKNPSDPVTKDFGQFQITYTTMSEAGRTSLRFTSLNKSQ